MRAQEYREQLAALPYGKRLPGAVYLLDPGDASTDLPPKLRVTVAELRKRLDIGPDFNLLKFHTSSPKISFLAYPYFNKDPHPINSRPCPARSAPTLCDRESCVSPWNHRRFPQALKREITASSSG